MNWGYKILTVIIVFIVGMLSMVTIAMRQTNDMVDEKYYDKEMAYQSLMTATENLQNLQATSLFSQNDTSCVLTLPEAATSNISTGTVEFLRPSDKKIDINVPLAIDASGKQYFSKKQFSNGIYKLRVKWQSATTPYYKEENIFINN